MNWCEGLYGLCCLAKQVFISDSPRRVVEADKITPKKPQEGGR